MYHIQCYFRDQTRKHVGAQAFVAVCLSDSLDSLSVIRMRVKDRTEQKYMETGWNEGILHNS